jgi:hypothetical protein
MAKRILRRVVLVMLVLAVLQIWLALRKPSFPVAPTNAQAAQSFDEKAGQLAQSEERGSPAEVRFTEAELNSEIQQYLISNPPPGGPAMLKNAAVHLEGDKLLALLTVNVKGVKLYVTLGGSLSFTGHMVRLVPSQARLGSLPLPASLLAARLDARLEVPPSITAVRVENGELVVQAR